MKQKLLLLLTALCFGLISGVKAENLPTPVYFNDFSSTEGLTVHGNGEFIDDADARFGRIFHNDPELTKSVRTNYLELPSGILSHSAESKAMTITFWVNKKDAADYWFSPIFTAYGNDNATESHAWPDSWWPFLHVQSRGILAWNSDGWCDFTAEQNDKGTNQESTTWLDDAKWHLYTLTLTSSTAKLYIDGEVFNSWTIAEEGLKDFFTQTSLTHFYLGGNQAFGWNDPDPAYGFDDFAVYDEALSAAQINQIVDTKLGRTTIYERTLTGATAWSSSDAAASGSDLNVWYGNMGYNENYGIYGKANGSRSSVMTFSHTANSIQTFDIVFNNLGNTGNAGNYSYLKIGSDIEIQSNQQNQNGTVIINGNSTYITDCNVKNYNRGGDLWTIHVEINTAEKKVTAFTLVGTTMNGKSAHYTMTSETALSSSATFNTVTVGFVRAGGTPATALSSITIKEQAQAVTNVNYTVNYKLGENVVKSVSDEGVVDQVITADAAIDGTEEGYVGNHYLIVAAETPSMTLVNGENILNVPVRAPYTATLTVTTNIGGEATPEVTNLVETDAKVCSWIYTYPMYVKKDGVYYNADEISSFGESGNFTNGQSISKTVNYTTAAPEVVWFKDINGTSAFDVAYSGGGYTNTNEQLANVTVDAGIYEVIFNVVSKAGSGSNHRNEGVSVNGENVANLTGNINGIRSLMINVSTDESVITAYGNGASNYTDNLDYVIIKKLPATVSATIGATGWTTFSSAYPLNLSDISASEGEAQAYYASSQSGSNIVMTPTESEGVAAGEGLMLKGTAGATVTIPVAVSGSSISGNMLVGCPNGETLTKNASHYLLYNNGGTAEFRPLTGDYSVTVPAGKAYLNAGVNGARLTIILDGDDPTAISAIEAAEAGADALKDGKYLINGKVVLVKNGVKYDANGKKLN